MLIKEALSIIQKANTKIAELGTQIADPDIANSPQLPALESQLNDCVNLFDLILKFVILNDAGTAIEGNNADNDAVVNSLLIQLQEVGELNSLVLPSPIVRIIVNENGSGGSFPAGASEGDLIYFHNNEWVRLAKGSDGDSLVATASSIQWQSQVGNGIPGGGSTNQFLKKNSNTSYDVAWSGIATTDITGLTASAAELNILDGATFSTTEANLLTGLTGGSLQSQLAAKLGTGLNDGQFYVGNGSNAAVAVTPTGDVVFNNAGVFAISAGVIVDADINASAAIARTKLASGNNYRLVTNGAAGAMTDAAAITASRVLISDANGIPTHSTISATNLTYLDATSSIQDQLNERLVVSLTTPAQGDMLFFNGTSWVNFTVGTNGQLLSSDGNSLVWVTDPPTGLPSGGTTAQILRKIDDTDYNAEWHTLVAADISDVSATAAEINILSGVTVTAGQINSLSGISSNVQTQLNNKLNNSLAQHAIYVGNASNLASQLSPGSNGQLLQIVAGTPQWQSVLSGFVDLVNNQTVGGIKTFSSFPVTPSSLPSSDYEVANKKYVDDATPTIADATDSVKGIAKLYTDLSNSNTDGAVTQSAIKSAVDGKWTAEDWNDTTKGYVEKAVKTEAETAADVTEGNRNNDVGLTARSWRWAFDAVKAVAQYFNWTYEINAQTGTTYTTVLSDSGKLITCSNTSAITVTIPLNSSVAYAIGTRLRIRRINTGAVTIAATGGVTINAEDNNLVIRKQYGEVELVKRDTDTWSLIHTPSSWWEWAKTQAQTFTAALTATDLSATNQAGTGNRLAIVDSDGKFLRYSNVSIDTTTGEIDIDGLDSLEATKTLRVRAQGVEQFAVTNNFKTIFAHNGSINWTVPDAITSGNANIIVNDDQEDALATVDKSLNRYESIRSETGNLAKIIEQSQENNYGEGFTVKTYQKRITTSTANAGWNTILSIPIEPDQAMSIHVDHLLAFATDGSRLIAYGDKDGVGYRDGSNNTSIDAPTMTMRGTLVSSSGGSWRMAADDTNEEIDIDFQNTATGKTFDVFLQITVIRQDLPV